MPLTGSMATFSEASWFKIFGLTIFSHNLCPHDGFLSQNIWLWYVFSSFNLSWGFKKIVCQSPWWDSEVLRAEIPSLACSSTARQRRALHGVGSLSRTHLHSVLCPSHYLKHIQLPFSLSPSSQLGWNDGHSPWGIRGWWQLCVVPPRALNFHLVSKASSRSRHLEKISDEPCVCEGKSTLK